MLHNYCVTYQNPGRRERMARRFETVGLDYTFVESLPATDAAIAPPHEDVLGKFNQKSYSAMCGHVMAYEQMLTDGHDMAIVCEDDVMLRQDIKQYLPAMVNYMNQHNIEILLTGYLTTEQPLAVNWSFEKHSEVFGYFNYPDGHWGVQQYIIKRSYAQHLIRYFGLDYAHRSLIDPDTTHYSTDWIITKMTDKRAMISPQLAVEECPPDIYANSDTVYHYECHMANYIPGLHI